MKKVFSLFGLILSLCGLMAQTPGEIIKNTLQPYIDEQEIPGVVTIIADKDKIIDMQCFGYYDFDGKKKMNPDALFWIASQSKPITGAALMMLVDENKVNLDDPVTKYLPELNDLMVIKKNSDGVQVLEKPSKIMTVRQVLSHTSGMQWVAGVQRRMGKIDVLPFSVSLYASAMTPLDCEPGEAYSYSNQGINIAATIVERVSGMPYDVFLQKRLFDPMGMSNATFWPTEKQLKNLALAYSKSGDENMTVSDLGQLQYPLNDRSKRYAEAAGGLFCSPRDLVKFYQMLAGGGVYNGVRYLSEASVREMGTKQTGNLPDPYGLGITATNEFMGHGGACGTDSRLFKNGIIVMYFIQSNTLRKADEALARFDHAVKSYYNLIPSEDVNADTRAVRK